MGLGWNFEGDPELTATERRAAAFQHRHGVRKLRKLLRDAGVEVEPTPYELAARKTAKKRGQAVKAAAKRRAKVRDEQAERRQLFREAVPRSRLEEAERERDEQRVREREEQRERDRLDQRARELLEIDPDALLLKDLREIKELARELQDPRRVDRLIWVNTLWIASRLPRKREHRR